MGGFGQVRPIVQSAPTGRALALSRSRTLGAASSLLVNAAEESVDGGDLRHRRIRLTSVVPRLCLPDGRPGVSGRMAGGAVRQPDTRASAIDLQQMLRPVASMRTGVFQLPRTSTISPAGRTTCKRSGAG
jgi:hypothetical protein